ncbi:MAG: FAD-dependent oxidoreductase [Lachnospiraceae bacterium]|nr:FAD-dependent oxidoreductase [Lachnospiraceae bacterium]
MAEAYAGQKYPHIFSELKIRGKVLKNRTISAPLAIQFTRDKKGFITERGMQIFGDFIKGGTGAVTLGEGKIDSLNSTAHPNHFECRDPDIIQQYHFFTEYVHAYGGLASIEFNHNGQHAMPQFNSDHIGPMGASEMIMPNGLHVKEMDKNDMDTVAESYAQAALIARRSGFDMILLHFAHGWLMGGFLSPLVNKRTDEYGGSYENRMRFPLQVIHRIREVAGENLIIEVRMSGDEYTEGGIRIEDAVEYAKILDADGNIDLLHMSAGTRMDGYTRAIMHPSHFIEECHNVKFSEAVKKAGVKIPVGIVGAVSDPDTVEQIIAEGRADYVVMARQLMADPNWANKAKHGHPEDIRRCLRCLHCFDTHRVNKGRAVLDDWQGTLLCVCDINPTWGHDALIGEIPGPNRSLKVAVVGGGPAGLTAAAEAARLGHTVDLFEQSASLGGLLKIFADPVWFKKGESRHREYLIRQTEKYGVHVHLNTKADPEKLKKSGYDAVLVAVGGKPRHPDLPVEKGSKVMDVLGIYHNEELLGKKVVIIGGGASGCEAALHLSSKNISSVILEKGDYILPDSQFSIRNHTIQYMDAAENLVYYEATKALRIADGGVYARDKAGQEIFFEADTVVYATGMESKEEAADAYSGTAVDVRKIGDCNRIGTMGHAIRDGYNAAVTLYSER